MDRTNTTPVQNITSSVQAPSNTSVLVPATSDTSTGLPLSSSRIIASTPIAESTVVSLTVIPSPSTIATLTTYAQTTLSSPIAVTLTDSSNGRKVVSTPAFLTVCRTLTESGGAFVTLTQIAANPPANSNGTSSSFNRSGFLHNQEAVAGLFVAMGLIFAAITAFLVLIARRRCRSNRRKRWLAGMQQRPNSFAALGPLVAPMVHSGEINDDLWDRKGGISPPLIDEPNASGHGGFGRLSVDGGLHLGENSVPWPAAYFDSVGFAITADKMKQPVKHHSFAPSTLSIYSSSLSPVDEDAAAPRLERPIVTPPPRAPRSMRRSSATGLSEYFPMTPPASSISSDNRSAPSSPTPDQQHLRNSVFNRRTILDVRPRSARSDGKSN